MIEMPRNVLALAAVLSRDISNLDLSVRTYNALRRWGITNISELVNEYLEGNLVRVRSLGNKGIFEIEHKLDSYLKPYLEEEATK